MKCPKCGSDNVQVIAKKKRRGILSILTLILLTVFTGGIWLIITWLRGRKEVTTYVCMDCGKEFK